MAMRGPWRFVSVILAMAFALLRVDGVVVLELRTLARSSGGRDLALDFDSLEVGDEAEEVEEEVGSRKSVVVGF